MLSEPSPAFWQGRRVFVTGCTGFLGSWMVRELNHLGAITIGFVRNADRASVEIEPDTVPQLIVVGEIGSYETLKRAIGDKGAETIFHLAAQAIVGCAMSNPRLTFETNIRGSWNVLEACRELMCQVGRVVIASSDKVYGEVHPLPNNERAPLNGRHPYDASKGCTEILAQTYHASYGLPVSITRFGNFFGGRDFNFSRIVPGTIRWALRGERPVLRSDGTMIRDYIYVRDAVRAYLLLAQHIEKPHVVGQAFNFSLEQPISVIQLVKRILVLMGRNDLDPVILSQASTEAKEQYLTAAKARKWLSWSPKWTLDDGLRETIEWYRARSDRFATD